MVSILSNLRGSNSTYDSDTVLAVWRAITESEQKPANAFSNLLTQLKLTPPLATDGTLSQCDQWLSSQLGVALMKMYADTQHWQSGFVVLHYLHRFKIRYIANCEPFTPLPPFSPPPPPSPCGLAMTAVTTCLRVDNIASAIEVLNGCEWIGTHSPKDREERTQLLATVAEKCLETSMYKECQKCLQELNSSSVKNRHFQARLHNKLLESVLSASDVDIALSVYSDMNDANLPCVPRNFSLLVEKLCELEQLSTARELCKSAVEKQFYPPVTRGSVFSISLPPSIHRVEAHSLIERHLDRMGRELEGKQLLSLSINFDRGEACILHTASQHKTWYSILYLYSSIYCFPFFRHKVSS